MPKRKSHPFPQFAPDQEPLSDEALHRIINETNVGQANAIDPHQLRAELNNIVRATSLKQFLYRIENPATRAKKWDTVASLSNRLLRQLVYDVRKPDLDMPTTHIHDLKEGIHNAATNERHDISTKEGRDLDDISDAEVLERLGLIEDGEDPNHSPLSMSLAVRGVLYLKLAAENANPQYALGQLGSEDDNTMSPETEFEGGLLPEVFKSCTRLEYKNGSGADGPTGPGNRFCCAVLAEYGCLRTPDAVRQSRKRFFKHAGNQKLGSSGRKKTSE